MVINNKIQPMSSSAATTLQKLLDQTYTHPKIKQALKLITMTREKITYHALVSSTETYLQLRGLANHDQDEFNYINRMLHTRTVGVLGRIKRKELAVRDFEEELKIQEEERAKEENAVNEEIIAEVEHVISNIDLPLSLFKRNDKYWYQDNPKTIEAKNYVHERIKEDRERKKKMRQEMMKKETEKERMERERMEKEAKEQEERKKQYHQEVKRRLEFYKKNQQQRQKSIEQSQKYTAALKPLYIKLQESQANSQLTALEQQKKRLSQLRKLHKSIDLAQIEQHKNKLIQMEKEKQAKKIFHEPVKVSYKSKYHTSMTTRSRIEEYETTKSLYEKKKEYGAVIKNQFKPKIDESLVEEIEERLKLMKRKRVRVNPKKKEHKKREDGEDDDDQDEDEQEENQNSRAVEQKSLPKHEDMDGSDDDEDDEHDEKRKPLRKLGEDEDYDRNQRYELGVQYLEYVRSLRKKKKEDNQNESKFVTNENMSETSKQKLKTSQRYKDYLKEFTKTNRSTIDHIDTTRMKSEYNKSIIGKSNDYSALSKLENETRMVETKINREQQLLKFKKLKNQDAVTKKVQIDNAVIETIKARLALMGG